jgi:serine/threonine-protein kinase
LVLELVEGPTLADRIAHGPVPVEDAVAIAKQIAEALEAAHARGVIHRDLKPANVKIRPDGTVKVLDFGLAKALDPSPSASDVSQSPTMTSPAMTRLGVILGTAAYMSPEQARGSAVDSRADVWSFGVVLYEMLAGTTLFAGATVSDTLAAVLRADLDWNRLPADVPPGVRTLLRRCLQREMKQRLQHIGDARIEIDDLQRHPAVTAQTPHASRRWGGLAVAALLAAAVVGPLAWSLRPAGPAGAPTSFIVRTLSDAPMSQWTPLALSPDGRHLVYVVGLGTRRVLVHQSLDAFDPRPLDENGRARAPFFSARGDAVGFHSESAGDVQQVRLSGGAATRLFDAVDSIGASWGEDGTVVFTPEWGQPLRIRRPAAVETTELTRLNVEAGERAHLWPQILPGGRAVLFTIWTGAPTWDEEQLAVIETAYLLSCPVSDKALGEGVDASSHIGQRSALGQREAGPAAADVQPDILDDSHGLAGDRQRLQIERRRRQRVATPVYDLDRRLLTPLPLSGDNTPPTWTRRGERLTFQSNAGGEYHHYSIPFDGGGRPEPLFSAELRRLVPTR